MFQQYLNKIFGSIGLWIFGKISPEIVTAEMSANMTSEAMELITFYMQNISFLLASVLALLGIWGYFRNSKKKEKR